VRLTINLDEDLYAMARAHAIASKTSISKAISDLLRRRTASNRPPLIPGGNDFVSLHPLSGFPVIVGDRAPVTDRDIRQAEEEDDLRIGPAAPESKGTGPT
jgi:hypothetical protein